MKGKSGVIIAILIVGVNVYFWISGGSFDWIFGDSDTFRNDAIGLEQVEEPISFPIPGAIYLVKDIITESDKSTLKRIRYTGQKIRKVYDRREGGEISMNAFLYNAYFDDNRKTEIQINPEFGDTSAAGIVARKYAWKLGQLPSGLRRDIQSLTIHKGEENLGGRNFNVLLYTGSAENWEENGALEEVLVHEAAHATMDMFYESTDNWAYAQNKDGRFITKYAEEHPGREDMAESFIYYIAVRHRPERLQPAIRDSILATIPNRFAYFDTLKIEMYPIE